MNSSDLPKNIMNSPESEEALPEHSDFEPISGK